MNTSDSKKDSIEDIIVNRLATMPLDELAYLGRPSVPTGKPQAVFVSCKKGMFTYNVRGKHFHPKDRGEVERLVKGKPGGDKKAEMKRLDRLLLRPLTLSTKVVSDNAIRRIREQMIAAEEAARVAKLCEELGAPSKEEHAGTYLLTRPAEEQKGRPPVKAEVVWDSRGFCAIKIDEARILPCHLVTKGSVWQRVVEKPDMEPSEQACCSKSDPCEKHSEAEFAVKLEEEMRESGIAEIEKQMIEN